MRGLCRTMPGDARNLDFEQTDACIEFVKRVPIEALAGEEACGSEIVFQSA